MQFEIPNPEFDRVATLDIETTHYKPNLGEVVSVGVGVHDAGTPGEDAEYELLHRTNQSVDNESELIKQSLGALNMFDADGLVSYKGRKFDVWFLKERLARNGEDDFHTDSLIPDTHIDLFEPREEQCNRTNEKWPSLDECLESYGLPVPQTTWGGSLLTNARFGEELGPAYIEALADDSVIVDGDALELQPVIEHYLQTDLEANIAIFYSDIGQTFEPAYLDSEKAF